MSQLGKLRRWVAGHSMWGKLPKRAQCDLAKLWFRPRRFTHPLPERDDMINSILKRYGRWDLMIVSMSNRDEIVRNRVACLMLLPATYLMVAWPTELMALWGLRLRKGL